MNADVICRKKFVTQRLQQLKNKYREKKCQRKLRTQQNVQFNQITRNTKTKSNCNGRVHFQWPFSHTLSTNEPQLMTTNVWIVNWIWIRNINRFTSIANYIIIRRWWIWLTKTTTIACCGCVLESTSQCCLTVVWTNSRKYDYFLDAIIKIWFRIRWYLFISRKCSVRMLLHGVSLTFEVSQSHG